MNTSRKPTPEQVARLEKQRIVDTLLKKADEAHTRHATAKNNACVTRRAWCMGSERHGVRPT